MTSIDVQHPADFPPEFIKAFQSGKLVFFCGAGVSNYRDKVPQHYHSFKDLAKAVLDKFNPSWEMGEQSIKYKWFQQELFDKLHKVLEERYGSVVDDIDIKELLQEKSLNYDELLEFLANKHDSDVVDKYIKSLFQENLPELEPTQHQTLINLAKQNPSGHIKIVTTNFDTLFTKALTGDDTIREFYAPRLPIPRSLKDYPSSITYLHGGVDKENPEPEWVYSTSGFGKAYIADGWASRFITELARNYYICFIGYSMNDQIMRYIFAGIKAVNQEHPDNVSKPLYIFQEQNDSEPKSPYEEKEKSQDLENLGLIPISFPKSFPKFTKMWQMLNEWHELQNRDIIELCQEAFQDFDENKETLTDLQRYVLQNLIPPADLYFGEDNPLNDKSYQRAFNNSNLFKHLETLPFGLLKAVQMVNRIQQRSEDERRKLPNVDYKKIGDF
ncbi:MAG: SIR2 family protein [Vampirovibrionales bacterium]